MIIFNNRKSSHLNLTPSVKIENALATMKRNVELNQSERKLGRPREAMMVGNGPGDGGSISRCCLSDRAKAQMYKVQAMIDGSVCEF